MTSKGQMRPVHHENRLFIIIPGMMQCMNLPCRYRLTAQELNVRLPRVGCPRCG